MAMTAHAYALLDSYIYGFALSERHCPSMLGPTPVAIDRVPARRSDVRHGAVSPEKGPGIALCHRSRGPKALSL